ncbi:MAG TPA: exodeoxyribonuclease V subunit gamma [Solirubrobacteraceae bacterium]|nr:exodeoxyribonuclease V subunit gamma [Solirubrobacteraceae bacterium]
MLHIHRAERADALADALAATLTDPLDDPFAPEIVSVATRGMERWLTQRFSTVLGASAGRSDGVCANVEFPFPGTLIAAAAATATGIDPDQDPWAADRLVWPLLQTVDEVLGEPWLAPLATHLENNRRFATVRHIADLYDRYGVRRPQMLHAWTRHEDTDGSGRALTATVVWQAELWRRLRARLALPSPPERLADAAERIKRAPAIVDLPQRLSLFGITRLPASYLQILRALAAQRDVHVFVLHPSPQLWTGLAHERPRTMRRREDTTATAPGNRLLASWGQDARELQLVLQSQGEHEGHHHPIREAPTTLLGRIQADVRADRTPPGPPLPGRPDGRPPLDAADRSLQIHACHGRARQVEVIRDAILHLLEDDPTLEPRDVIVMCPDIETIAPLIQATFGAGRVLPHERDGDPDADTASDRRLPDLRVRLADRSLRQTNPVLGVVSLLLELADERVTASQLLDLADREPVRRRFRFDDEDITRMEEWVVASGIRWGLDEQHRAPYKLDVVTTNTWAAGLDRILLGVAMTEEDRRLVGGVLPLDDVESGAIDLAGRMAEFVGRVHQTVDDLSRCQTIGAWAAHVATAADALTQTSDRDSWQRAQLQRILDDVVTDATGEDQPSAALLELADIRALLADRLRGRPTRANFRTGHLTVCTLVPMRSVPHRVVCILGLDDGEFPRKAPRDGDDLLLDDPHLGDRDPRAEDRQMLLDALLAATERLIITYTGNDERTNLVRPPAVPVAELLDVVDRTVRVDGESTDAREHVLIRHPLQPFDPRNFAAGALAPGGPWSFDRVALDGARALCGPRRGRPPFLAAPLPELDSELVELESLVRFVEHPVRAFLRGRLGISVRESLDEVQDGLPIELDGLGHWGVGQRLLEGVLAGADLEDCIKAELARGLLPPAMLATPVIDGIRPVVEQLAASARAHTAGPSDSLDVHVRLPDGRTLAGTVAGVHTDTIRRVSYSRVRPRDRLGAWVRLLALSAARAERPLQSVVIGRARAGSHGAQTTLAQIPALGGDATQRHEIALTHLQTLVDLYDRGMREPLPIACDSSAAYAQAANTGEDPELAAQKQWETGFRYDKEDRQPEHMLVYGGQLPFAELLSGPPRPDERASADPQQETTRFGIFARRLWDDLLAHERLVDR